MEGYRGDLRRRLLHIVLSFKFFFYIKKKLIICNIVEVKAIFLNFFLGPFHQKKTSKLILKSRSIHVTYTKEYSIIDNFLPF